MADRTRTGTGEGREPRSGSPPTRHFDLKEANLAHCGMEVFRSDIFY